MSVKFIPSDTFKNGCMLCTNQKVSIFNPDGKTTVEYTVEASYQTGKSYLFVRDTTIEVEQEGTCSLQGTEKSTRTKGSPHDVGKRNLGYFAFEKKLDYKTRSSLEKEMRDRDREYERRVKESLKYRKLWKDLLNSIDKMKIKAVANSRGPEWYQDLSHIQIQLLKILQTTLKADLEEGIISRTKRLLTSLGVTVNIPSRKVFHTNKECHSDPVCFLLEMYNAVVEIEAKTRPDLSIDEYSVNQRLLLSSVCTLHLPVLLNLMHLLLPAPLPYSSRSIALVKAMYDCDKVRYSHPHLVSLPDRAQKWLEVLSKQEVTEHVQFSLDVESERKGSKGVESTSSVHRILIVDEDNKDGTTGGRRLTAKFQPKFTSKKFYVRKNTFEEKEPDVSSVIADKMIRSTIVEDSISSDPKPCQVLATIEGARLSAYPPTKGAFSTVDDSNAINQQSFMSPDYHNRVSVEVGILSTTSKLGLQSINIHEADKFSMLLQPDGQEQPTGSLMIPTVNDRPSVCSKSPVHSTLQHEGGSILNHKPRESNNAPYSEHNEYVTGATVNQEEQKTGSNSDHKHWEVEKQQIEELLDNIATTPVNQQLQYVINLLAQAGDPLALFPDVHRIPSVKRWFELRRGIKIRLSKKENDELIKFTTEMWKNTPVMRKLKIPKLDIPKNEQALLTWDDQQRVRKKVNEQLSLYFTQLREQKVNNTRALFPTMLTQYYTGTSKLNRQYQKVFYTYLPGRAADTFVYRPWQREECKPKQKPCY